MALSKGSVLASVLSLSSLAGCKAEDEFTKPESETGDDGLFTPDVDLPSGEVGEDPTPLPPGQCIQFPQDNLYGYWHQCFGEITVSFTAEYNDKVYSGEDLLHFGPGELNEQYWKNPDSYDNPLVAACCGPYNYDTPTSEQKIPYVNNCMFDAIQQICIGLPKFVRKQANETADLFEKAALGWIANKLEAEPSGCVWGLWEGGPPGPDGASWFELAGTSWTPEDADLLTLRIEHLAVYDWTVADDAVSLTPCSGIFDNDDAVVPTAAANVPGVIYAETLPLVPGGTASALGLGSDGRFVLSSDSSEINVGIDGAGGTVVQGLRLEGEPTNVNGGGEPLTIDRARVVLQRPLEPLPFGSDLLVESGEGSFLVSLGSVNNESRVVPASNASRIVFRNVQGRWDFDPFDIEHIDAAGFVWTITVEDVTFGR